MPPRTSLLLLALGALVLSGCLSAKKDATPEAAAGLPAGAAAPGVAGAAGNATRDLDHMPHIHDYWLGRERVTLFDGDVQGSPDEAVGEAAFNVFIQKQARAGGVNWRLPDKAIVYEGSGELDVTATWSDPTVTGLALATRAPGAQAYTQPVDLASGSLLKIPLTPGMTDMPHMSVSRWAFYFEPSDPGLLLGTFHLKVDIVKMNDVSLFPGHPELFFGKHEKTLLDADGKSAQVSYVKRIPNLATSGQFGENEFPPKEIVPMETRLLKIDVTVTKATAQVGSVSQVGLFYHGANTEEMVRAPEKQLSGSLPQTLTWLVPVKMEMTDTPYGHDSQWRLMVEAQTSLTGQDRACGGCEDTDIEFHALVTAYDHELAKDAAPGA